MKKLLFFILVLLGCTSTEKVFAPEFEVVVKLSPKAIEELSKMGEAIKVNAFFDGDGEKLQGVKTAPHRDVFLGSTAVEVEIGDVAYIKDVSFKRDDFNRLYVKDYYVTLNIVSARRVHKNNILRCDVPTKRISKFTKGKTITVIP